MFFYSHNPIVRITYRLINCLGLATMNNCLLFLSPLKINFEKSRLGKSLGKKNNLRPNFKLIASMVSPRKWIKKFQKKKTFLLFILYNLLTSRILKNLVINILLFVLLSVDDKLRNNLYYYLFTSFNPPKVVAFWKTLS